MLRLYDTRTRRLEPIRPAEPGPLRVYGCGPTVYRDQHVGNMRTFLLSDLIVRVSELHSMPVELVINITDVGHLVDDEADTGEDKLVSSARSQGRSVLDVARHYEQEFHRDLAALNIRPAAAYPRASESIPLMIELVSSLLKNGSAYQGEEGTVWFDARSFGGYGELSGNRLNELRPADVAPGKRFHADWALWKPADRQSPVVYESPFGPGFPGWHLECSAMSLAHFGESVDVHTGGIDLRFPHHEDERAQSEAAVGHEVVHHWVHGEHLLFEGRKMAKSTGNVVLVRDVVAAGLDPLAVRLAMLSLRYRQQSDLSWESLRAADRTLTRWRAKLAEWADLPSRPVPPGLLTELHGAFDDDLDTPAALILLREAERRTDLDPGAKFELFAHADRVLALDLVRDVGSAPAPLPPGAEQLLEARRAAREERRFADSDRLREELAALGVEVRDTADGQTWSRLRPVAPPRP